MATAALVLAACAPAVDVVPLPVGVADYQLGEAYRPAEDVTVVVRDATATPEPGVYSVCYVNAFQTQPGSGASRRSGSTDSPGWVWNAFT